MKALSIARELAVPMAILASFGSMMIYLRFANMSVVGM